MELSTGLWWWCLVASLPLWAWGVVRDVFVDFMLQQALSEGAPLLLLPGRWPRAALLAGRSW